MVHMAGHIPATLLMPGSWTEAAIIPPVKQNLFLFRLNINIVKYSGLHTYQDVIIPGSVTG